MSRRTRNLLGRAIVVVVLTCFELSQLYLPVLAASSPWTQTDWSGGSGQTSWSDGTKFSSASSATTSTSGEVTLTNTEELSNTGFESNLTSWDVGKAPNSVSGLTRWYKADAITGLSDGGSVATWNDSSGNGGNATQSTDINKPTYRTNVMNGNPVVRFDGVNDLLSLTNPSVAKTHTIIMAIKPTSLSALSAIVAGDGANFFSNQLTDTNISYGAGLANSVSVAHGAAANETHIFTITRNGATVKFFKDGSQIGSTQTLSSNVDQIITALGASAEGTSFFTGDMAEILIYDVELSTANKAGVESYLQQKYNVTVSGGITLSRDTATSYNSSAASAKLVATNTGELTQTVNVGDTNTYNLVAYARTDGSAVTSSDLELFSNGSAVSTTFTSAGNGWYKLTGVITGANANRTYGVQVKSGKTVYIDNLSLNSYASSATLTSSIFDTEITTDWGNLTYSATTPTNTSVSVKARSSNSSTMSGATAFSSCSTINSGTDLSTASCMSDGHRYVQYQLTLSNTDTTLTPTFEEISIAFVTQIPTAPSSLSGSAGGTASINWSWIDNSSNESGFYILDTSGNIKCTVSTANTTSCSEGGLSPDKTYVREVVSFNDFGRSTASTRASATTRKLATVSLDSPGADSNVNSERPTFKFKAPSDNSDTIKFSDIGSYKLLVKDAGNNVIFSITDIPTSRTTKHEQSHYQAQYEGFADSDNTNNYISVITKSSSLWGQSENDGRIKPGKLLWSISSVDGAGNENTVDRTIYFDSIPPSLKITSTQSSYRTTKPQLNGLIQDNISPSKIGYTIQKINRTLGTIASLTTVETGSLNLTEIDNLNQSFTLTPANPLELGQEYIVKLIPYDKAGNAGELVSATIFIGSSDQIEEISLQTKSNLLLEKLGRVDLPLIEAKKPALQKETAKELQNLDLAAISALTEAAVTAQNTLHDIYLMIGQSTYSLTSQSTTLAISSTNIIISSTASALHSTVTLSRSILPQTAGIKDKVISSKVESVEDATRSLSISTANTVMVASAVNHEVTLASSKFTASNQQREQRIKSSLSDATSSSERAKNGVLLTTNAFLKPIDRGSNLINRSLVAVNTIYSLTFDPNPTRISDVQIEKISPNAVAISWRTNHPTTNNKINYGESLSYGKEAYSAERKLEHRFVLSDLTPGQTYYFEVMSQNKNYAYDAYYSFTADLAEREFIYVTIEGGRDDIVNVRESPATQSAVVHQVFGTERFKVLDTSNKEKGWIKIEKGWVPLKSVTID